MPELAEIPEPCVLDGLNERIDELSTRLIIDGVGTLAAADFAPLVEAARASVNPQCATIAARLAALFAKPAAHPVATLTGLVSSGLDELRRALDQPVPSAKIAAAPQPAPAPELPSLAADEEMIREFITESGEHLANIEGQMLLLEKNSGDLETLNAVFRAFHTIKGLAGFLEFLSIQSLAHEVETLLDLTRTAKLTVTSTVVDLVLECTDVLRRELAGINLRLAGQTPPPSSVDAALLQSIRDVAQGGTFQASPPVTQPLAASVPAPAAPATATKPAALADAPASQPPPAPAAAAPPTPNLPAKSAAEPPKAADNASVRIDTAKLDQLMDMVGEMVIAQTLIGHSPALTSVRDPRFLRDLTQLARITADVQRITTGMRMVPIGIQFQKTARLIRDLSRRAGKHIVLETTGDDTELDKTIAEELSDPLLHMVRNSIDHGIEPPDERIALGKDPTARIRISAYHQSGQIVIAISDDGRGLNRERILAKALQNGLIAHGAQLSDNEIFLLIFEAGFSTAEKITDISGRGVGMDVVRKHVQKLRGRIEIESQPGLGTTFFLKLPLTLAIIEGLVVIVGDQRYIVPIYSVKEMFRPTPDMLSTVHQTGEMVMVRGGLMPILRLHRRFETVPRTTDFTNGVLIVAETAGKQFCLFVDDLVGKQEVVIKSLGESFKHIEGIAGCAILGDGRVGLILDIDGIYKGRS